MPTFYQLIPFPRLTHPNIEISAEVQLKEKQLHIIYKLSGEVEDIVLSDFQELKEADNLWKTTCFECFCLLEGGEAYIELNFSPKGFWHIYYFDGYRQSANEPKQLIDVKDISIKSSHNNYRLEAFIAMSDISVKAIGLTAVLENKQQELSYWALKHTATEPDFHQKISFIIPVV